MQSRENNSSSSTLNFPCLINFLLKASHEIVGWQLNLHSAQKLELHVVQLIVRDLLVETP